MNEQDKTKDAIAAYLASHRYLTLATADKSGQPMAHTVGYHSEGAAVWFMTDRESRKALNLAHEPRAAFTVDEDYDSVLAIKGVQARGRVVMETDASAISRAMAGLLRKFPEMAHMPPNPMIAVYRFDPAEARFLDNSKGFGYRDIVGY